MDSQLEDAGGTMRQGRLRLLVLFLVLAPVFLGACIGARGPAGPAGPLGLSGVTSAVVALVNSVEPTVVRLDVATPGSTMAGSGFIVDSRGYVLTNHHVIDQATQINVTVISGDSYNATVVASDAKRDLALLKMSTNRTGFATAVLGSSADMVVGLDVVAVGFPLGPDLPGPATFSVGIVSAIRTMHGLKYIQTDVITINPGSSGGPLVDLQGKVVGIAVAGVVPTYIDAEGIGLVIPIDEAKRFVQSGLGK